MTDNNTSPEEIPTVSNDPDGDAPDMESLEAFLFDLAEGPDAMTVALFEIIKGLDALTRNEDGSWVYSQDQRDLIMRMSATYDEAGFSE